MIFLNIRQVMTLLYPNIPSGFSAHSKCWSRQAGKMKCLTYLPVSTPHCSCGYLSGFEHIPLGVIMFLPQIFFQLLCSQSQQSCSGHTPLYPLLPCGCCLLLLCLAPLRLSMTILFNGQLPCWRLSKSNFLYSVCFSAI